MDAWKRAGVSLFIGTLGIVPQSCSIAATVWIANLGHY
jgi:hypothetical protein